MKECCMALSLTSRKLPKSSLSRQPTSKKRKKKNVRKHKSPTHRTLLFYYYVCIFFLSLNLICVRTEGEEIFNLYIFYSFWRSVSYANIHFTLFGFFGVQFDILPGRFYGGLIVDWIIRVRAISSFVDIFAGMCFNFKDFLQWTYSQLNSESLTEQMLLLLY